MQPLQPAKPVHVLEGLERDFTVRLSLDKASPVFAGLDDEWLFTRSTFERLAAPARAIP